VAARKPFVPPRWFVTTAWRIHRGIARRGPGRGLWTTADRRGWGTLTLTTRGRRTGEPRLAILGYLEDGDRWHALAMNGWGEGHPAWWLNLKAEPRATVMLADGSTHEVIATKAEGAERDRLWRAWTATNADLEALAGTRSTPTDIVVLTPTGEIPSPPAG